MTHPDRPYNLLRRNFWFRRFWLGETASLLGDQVTALALPLTAVLVLHAGAVRMGYLTALGLAPFLVLSLPVGVWLDRKGRRRQKMIAADLARVLLLASVPAFFALGFRNWAPLYLVAVLVGVARVVFSLGYPSMVAAVVPAKQYVAANTWLQGSRAATNMAGPAFAGFLIQWLSAPLALLVDAASFAASALGLASIHPPEPEPAAAQPLSFMEGLRFVWTTPPVRLMLLGLSTVNLFNFMFQALYVLYATRTLHIHPGTLGTIFGIGAGGAVLGALTAPTLSKRLGVGMALIIGTTLFTISLVLVPLAVGTHVVVLGMLMLAEFGSGFGVMVLDISFGSLSLGLVPDDIRARVTGAFSLVNYGIRPIGALLGGWLPGVTGLHGTLWVATAGASCGVFWLLPRVVRQLQQPAAESDDRQMES